MALVPPLAIGNRVSRILCPVTSGMSGIILRVVGLPNRTGHFCIIMTFLPPMTATVSSTVNSPDLMSSTTPLVPLGTMILCRMDRSGTVPMI